MTKSKHLILIVICILLPVATLAQSPESGYYAGYIVNEQGDTLRGNLKKQNNYLSPEIVTFKYNGQETDYGPAAIKAFYIEDLDLLFESHLITRNKYNNTSKPIRGEVDLLGPEQAPKIDFLLTIVKTKDIGIYKYTKPGEQERLYVGKDNKLDELIFIKQLLTTEEGLKLNEKRRYRIQLLGALIGCTSVSNKINSSNYNEQSIAAVLKAYAKCKNEPLLYNSYDSKSAGTDLNFGLNAAYGSVISADIDGAFFSGGVAARARNSELESGSWFELGLTAFFSTKRDSRVSFRTELKLKSERIESIWSRPTLVPNLLSRNNFVFKSTFISLGFLADINLASREKSKFFLETGFFFGTALFGEFESDEMVFLGNNMFDSTVETRDVAVRTNDLVVVTGIGMTLNQFGGSLRFNYVLSKKGEETTAIVISAISGVSLNLFYLL